MSSRQTKPKRTGGRPTKYTSERGVEFYRLMARGYSIGGAAGAMGLTRQSIYNWAAKHEEFADTLKLAKTARIFFLERILLTSKKAAEVRVAMTQLKHAAPEEFSPARARRAEEAAGKKALAELYKTLIGSAIRPPDCPDEGQDVADVITASSAPETASQAAKGTWTAANGGYLITPETVAEVEKRDRRPNYQRRRRVSAAAV